MKTSLLLLVLLMGIGIGIFASSAYRTYQEYIKTTTKTHYVINYLKERIRNEKNKFYNHLQTGM